MSSLESLAGRDNTAGTISPVTLSSTVTAASPELSRLFSSGQIFYIRTSDNIFHPNMSLRWRIFGYLETVSLWLKHIVVSSSSLSGGQISIYNFIVIISLSSRLLQVTLLQVRWRLRIFSLSQVVRNHWPVIFLQPTLAFLYLIHISPLTSLCPAQAGIDARISISINSPQTWRYPSPIEDLNATQPPIYGIIEILDSQVSLLHPPPFHW